LTLVRSNGHRSGSSGRGDVLDGHSVGSSAGGGPVLDQEGSSGANQRSSSSGLRLDERADLVILLDDDAV
jgi:hypothetical protein